MSELAARHHGLEAFLRNAPTAGSEACGAKIQFRPGLDHINLRGDPADRRFLSAAQRILGQSLPLEANTLQQGAITTYWLGLQEWLILTSVGHGDALVDSLTDAIGEAFASVTVLSGGQICMRISGPMARALLAKGCTLDLHPRNFAVGDCAQTGLAKAAVLLGMVGAEPVFDIVVRRSFADYLAQWLQAAGREYGVVFSTDPD